MNKFKLLITPLLILPFLACCGGKEKAEEYTVTIEDLNGVQVSPTTAIKGEDYVGTIAIDVLVIKDKLLPESLTKVTSGNKELIVHQGYTYTLKDDKLSADFKIPAANIVGDISIQLSLIPKPEPEPTDPHVVTKQEFIDAVTFKDVQYLQTTETSYSYEDGSLEPTFYIKNESSPSVYYYLGSVEPIDAINGPDYHEKYCRKNENPTSYDYCHRYAPDDNFTFKTGDEYSDEFMTPQSLRLGGFDATLAEVLEVCLDPDFCSSFEYIKEESAYKAEVSVHYYKYEIHVATIILKFENKKIINYEFIIDDEGRVSGTFTYLEKTPEYPTQPAEF